MNSTGRRGEVEIWAQLMLAPKDEERVASFFIEHCGIQRRHIVQRMHLTVYHAQRDMPGVRNSAEPAGITIPASDTRFMVMTTGGESPQPHITPGVHKVGLRLRRQSPAFPSIQQYRQRLASHESVTVLGARRPSTAKRNAFGAYYFQPHMTVLHPGNGIESDLTRVGTLFRELLGDLHFDRFVVHVSRLRF